MWRSFINCIKSVLAECWLPPLNVTSVLWIVEIYTLPSIPSSLFFLLLHRFTFSLPFYIWYLTDVGSTLQITAFLSRLPSRYCVFCKPFLCYSKMSNQLRADQARDSVEQARDSFGSILSYYRHNHESMESVPRWVDSADSSSVIISLSSTVAPSAEQTESYKEHLRELLAVEKDFDDLPGQERDLMIQAANSSKVKEKGAGVDYGYYSLGQDYRVLFYCIILSPVHITPPVCIILLIVIIVVLYYAAGNYSLTEGLWYAVFVFRNQNILRLS